MLQHSSKTFTEFVSNYKKKESNDASPNNESKSIKNQFYSESNIIKGTKTTNISSPNSKIDESKNNEEKYQLQINELKKQLDEEKDKYQKSIKEIECNYQSKLNNQLIEEKDKYQKLINEIASDYESKINELNNQLNEVKDKNQKLNNEIECEYKPKIKELKNLLNKEKEKSLPFIIDKNDLEEKIKNLIIENEKLKDQLTIYEKNLAEKDKEIPKLISENNLNDKYEITSINPVKKSWLLIL